MTLASSLALAATGRILDEVEAQQADSTALGAEVELFKSIGMGIALALSQCEGQTSCKPNVNQEELQHLLDTMDKRINTLMTRQEQNQGDFTDVITAYVTERDSYNGYQQKLIAFSSWQDVGEHAAPAGPPSGQKSKTTEQETDLSVFKDVDEGIKDDPGSE